MDRSALRACDDEGCGVGDDNESHNITDDSLIDSPTNLSACHPSSIPIALGERVSRAK